MIQHEYDHLIGEIFLNKVENENALKDVKMQIENIKEKERSLTEEK